MKIKRQKENSMYYSIRKNEKTHAEMKCNVNLADQRDIAPHTHHHDIIEMPRNIFRRLQLKLFHLMMLQALMLTDKIYCCKLGLKSQ